MTTNFFQQLVSFQIEGDWNINIKTGKHNRMIVSVLLKNEKVNDPASKLIPPMIIKGTSEELDNTFFKTIENPARQTATLFVNMEQYDKALEEAKLQSKMEKNKQDATKKEKEIGDKRYETQMKKVAELEAAGKFREAYGQLPKPADFPEQETTIQEKKQELTAKFDQPALF